MGRLAQARKDASGNVSLSVDSSAVTAASAAYRSLGSDIRSVSRELDSASAGRVLGLTDNGAIKSLTQDLAGASRGMSELANNSKALGGIEQSASRASTSVAVLEGNASRTEQTFTRLGGTSSSVASQLGSDFSQAEKAMTPVDARVASVSTGLRSMGSEGSAASSAIADGFDTIGSRAAAATDQVSAHAQALTQVRNLAGAGGGQGLMGPPAWIQARNAGQAFAPNNISSLFSSPSPSSPGVGGPPPGNPPGGRGGRGGPPGGTPRTPAAGADDGGGLSGLHDLGRTGLMGLMGGAVDELIGGGAGIASVMETIKNVPSLAAAGTAAMGEFNKSVGAAGASAAAQGVPAMQRLGAALGGLGKEVGTIGAQQMNNVLSGATQLAGTATTALTNMAPAIGPAVQGAVNLGNALLNGVGSPGVVAAIKSVGEGLQGAGAATAVSALTTGLLSSAGVITRVAEDAVGAVGSVLNVLGGPTAADAAAPALTGGVAGAMQLSKMYGGGKAGGVAGAISGASAMGIGSIAQQQGVDPTAGVLANIGASALGTARFGPVGGSLLGAGAQLLTTEAQAKGGKAGGIAAGVATGALDAGALALMLGQPELAPVAALVGGVAGGITAAVNQPAGPPPPTPAGQFPTGDSAPSAGRYGWQADPKTGVLSPSNVPTGGGGQLPGGPAQPYSPQAFQQPPPPPVPPPTTFAGQGHLGAAPTAPTTPDGSIQVPGGVGTPKSAGGSSTTLSAQTQAALGLNTANQTAASSYNSLGSSAGTSTAGLSQSTAHVTAATTAQTNLAQSASNAQPALQQSTQQSQAATTASAQLAKAAPQATAAVQQAAPQVTQALAATSTAVASGGAAIGAAVPAAIGAGITSNTPAACAASTQLASNTANCASSTLKAASPSRVFADLGQGIGDGLAMGIRGSAGGATNAVRDAMGDVVGAGAKGLNAHSPSQEFADLGAAVPAGLMLGLMRGSDGTIDAVANLTGAMQQAHENNWNPTPAVIPAPTAESFQDSSPDNLLRQQSVEPPPPPPDTMTTLNSELAQQNAANLGPAAMSAIQQQNTPHGAPTSGGPASGGVPLGAANQADLTKNLSSRGWSPTTVDTVQKYLNTKQAILDKTMQQHDDNKIAAQLKVGMTGYKTPGGSNDPFDPKSQNQVQAHQAMLDRRAISTQAVLTGRTPQQVMNDQQNAGLGMGPSTSPPGTTLPSSGGPTPMGGIKTSPATPGVPIAGKMGSEGPSNALPTSAGPSTVQPAGTVGPAAGHGYDNYGWALGKQAEGNARNNAADNAGRGPANTVDGPHGGGKMGGEAPAAGEGQSTGSNFSSGFAGGIAAGVGGVVTAAGGLVSNAVSTVATALGITSPSRVMAWHGSMSAEGFARGIEGNRGPRDSMRRMVRDAMDGGRDEWGRPWDWPWGGMGGGSGSGGGGSSGGGGGSGSGGGSGLGGAWGRSHGLGGWGHHGWGHGGWGDDEHDRHDRHRHHGHHRDHDRHDRHDRDRDDDHGGDHGGGDGGGDGGDHGGGGWGHGGGGRGGWWDRADRWMDRLDHDRGGRDGGRDGGGHGGWGDHGGWGGGGDWGGHGDHMGWMFGSGGMGGSGSGSGSGGGNPPYTGMNPWWAEHPGGRGGRGGWGEHGDHGGWGEQGGRDHDRGHHGDHDDDRHDGDHGDHDRGRDHDRGHGRDRHRDHDRDDHRGHDRERRHDDRREHLPMMDHLGSDNMSTINNQSHQMGQAVAQGMSQGMQQNQSQVTQAAAAIAQSAVSTVRSQLGIASPSKVFFEIGGDAVKGFSHGLRTGVGVVAENSQSLSQIATEQMAEGLKTGKVNQGYSIGLNRWLDGLKVSPNFIPFSDWKFDENLVGGFASSVQAAADGTKGIADSSGLMVGDTWARSMTTGVDNVLQSSQFSALTSPAVGSALAMSQLGAAGLLGPAGSGAEYYNVSSGNPGMVSMGGNATAPVVHATINATIDGTPLRVIAQNVVDVSFDNLVNSIATQRG